MNLRGKQNLEKGTEFQIEKKKKFEKIVNGKQNENDNVNFTKAHYFIYVREFSDFNSGVI